MRREILITENIIIKKLHFTSDLYVSMKFIYIYSKFNGSIADFKLDRMGQFLLLLWKPIKLSLKIFSNLQLIKLL